MSQRSNGTERTHWVVMGESFASEDEARAHVETQHVGPFILGDYADVERDALAMSYFDAQHEIDGQVAR